MIDVVRLDGELILYDDLEIINEGEAMQGTYRATKDGQVYEGTYITREGRFILILPDGRELYGSYDVGLQWDDRYFEPPENL